MLYLPDIGSQPRRAQQGLLFLLSKLERYNVRLVCSCSRPLQELLVDPACDNRLLTALSSVIVPIPSLREHADDIVELAQQLLAELIDNKQVPAHRLTTAALNALRQYDWPGNLEQLRSIIKSLALTADSDDIDAPEVNKVLAQFRQENHQKNPALTSICRCASCASSWSGATSEYHIGLENGNMSRVAQKSA